MNKRDYPKGHRKRVPESGWATADWVEEAIEVAPSLGPTPWETKEIIKLERYPQASEVSFVAGVLWAGLWFAGECSGGRLREVTRNICGTTVVDSMMLQRFLEAMESVRERGEA